MNKGQPGRDASHLEIDSGGFVLLDSLKARLALQ